MTSSALNEESKRQLAIKYPKFMNMYNAWKNNTPKTNAANVSNFNKELDTLFGEGKTTGSTTTKVANTTSKVSNASKLGQYLKNVQPGISKAGAIAAALGAGAELPRTIRKTLDSNVSGLQKAQAITGNTMLAAAAKPNPFSIPLAAGGTLLVGASEVPYEAINNNKGVGYFNLKKNIVKPLTKDEQNYLAGDMSKQTPQQFLNQIKKEGQNVPQQNYYQQDNLPAPETSNPNTFPFKTTQAQSNAIAGPGTGVDYNSGVSYPVTNLPSLNGSPTSANINQGEYQMGQQPIVGDYINAARYYNQQAQHNIPGVPKLGITEEELAAYQNALAQQNAGATQSRRQIEGVREALAQDRKNQRMVDVANAIGAMFGGPRTEKYYIENPFTQQVDQFTFTKGKQFTPMEYRNNLAKEAIQDYQLSELDRKAQQGNADAQAKLLNAARISKETGLPINITIAMDAKDYLNYLKPTQEAQRDIAIEGAKAIDNLYNTDLEGQYGLNKQNLMNKGFADVANIKGQYQLADTEQKITDPNRQFGDKARMAQALSYLLNSDPKLAPQIEPYLMNLLGLGGQAGVNNRPGVVDGLDFNY